MFLRRICPSLALALFTGLISNAADQTTSVATTASRDPLVAAFEQAMPAVPHGGFVIAEIDGGQVRYATIGSPEAPSTVAPECRLFEIGSITKVFTGLLLAQATLDGKAQLDDPIARHLPADLALDPKLAAITLQQLSTHTSGLPSLPDNFAPANQADPYADYSSERLYAFLRAYHPEKAAPQPGEYSNLGVGLLGHLLERMYGISYAELVRAKITGPLGMEDTIVELTREQEQRFVTPHSGASVVSPWRLTSMAGAGALRSTAADLVKFVRALLDPRSVIAPAWQIARKPRAAFGRRGQIGLGIMIAPRGDQTIYHHSGGTGGFRTYLEFAANDSRGTVVLLNNDTLEPAVIVAAVRRPAPVADAARRMPPEVAATPDELRAFTGVYAIDSRGRFTVVLDEAGRLRIRLTGQAFLPVRYAGQDRCFNSAVAAQFRFSRDATGRVDGLVLQQNGEEVSARRTADAPAVRFLPLEKLRDYAGSYVLAPGQVFEISATPLTLVAKLTGQPAFPVHCTSEDRFVYDVVEAALTFERGASGAVVALVLHQGGLDQRATKQAKP